MITELIIPILHKKLGVAELSDSMVARVEQGLENPDNRLVDIIGALINIHKADYHDARAIRDKFRSMSVKLLKQRNGDLGLFCTGVPIDCLYDGENVIWQAVEQITAAIRDIVFPPEDPGEEAMPEQVSAYVRKFAEHAGLLYRGERGLVNFIWGGHRVSRQEYEFAKQTGYWLALSMPDMENITGCGEGIMKAPFKGAQVAYGKQRSFERFGPRDFIGLTEKNILAAEPPNELVNRLVVFPTIEKRMEAFIRASHMGRAHPGGPGTMEEILTMLAVLSHPVNRNISYDFDLVERTDGEYFKSLETYLRTCFKDELNGLYDIHLGSPSSYAKHVAGSTSRLHMRYLWNDELYFDPRVQKPFEVTFDSMEALDLSRDQEPFDLIINLRRFFSAIVHLSVKDPDMLDSWGDDRPLIRGDLEVVKATDRLVQDLKAQGRIHPSEKYSVPYRIG